MAVQTVIEKVALQEAIESYLNEHLVDYLSRFQGMNEVRLKELSIIERVVRVEEELRHLREIEMVRHESLMKEMNTRFEAMDSRFAALQKEMNTRFEAMDSRFAALQKEMNTRFEALQKEMNTRFEALQKEMNTRFEAMNSRFEAIDSRFEAMNTRFEAMNTRFEALEKRLSFIQWLIGTAIALTALFATFAPFLYRKFIF
jgi:chaperonin cofactor prefoldin